MDDYTVNRIIDIQAEITALRGVVRMLIQNVYGGDGRSLAIIREEALRGDDLKDFDKEPNDRGQRYRDGVREAVASLSILSNLTMMKLAAWPIPRLKRLNRNSHKLA